MNTWSFRNEKKKKKPEDSTWWKRSFFYFRYAWLLRMMNSKTRHEEGVQPFTLYARVFRTSRRIFLDCRRECSSISSFRGSEMLGKSRIELFQRSEIIIKTRHFSEATTTVTRRWWFARCHRAFVFCAKTKWFALHKKKQCQQNSGQAQTKHLWSPVLHSGGWYR